MRFRPELDGTFESRGRIADAECHGTYRRPMRLGESLSEGARLGIDDEIDVALRMQRDVLAAMPGDHREAEAFEQAAQQLGVGGGVFDEFESVRAHWICL